MPKSVLLTAFLIFIGFSVSPAWSFDKTNRIEAVARLGLPKLERPTPTFHSFGAEARAQKLASAIADMSLFYQKRLGIRAPVHLAVLNSNDWAQVCMQPYGMPHINGTPPVIFMPATSGGIAFHLMMARKDAIPTNVLGSYLKTHRTQFEAAADEFVDIVGYHELGHALCARYGIAPGCHWLEEYIASYFAYGFIAERRMQSREVFALLGRPSKVRPKITTLDDFERLYGGVDDYGWYQGMFETHIQSLYPRMGLQFLKELRQHFPSEPVALLDIPVPNNTRPDAVVAELEKFAPGFQKWAEGFRK